MSTPQKQRPLKLRPRAEGIAKIQALHALLLEKAAATARITAAEAPVTGATDTAQPVAGNDIGNVMQDGTVFAGISPTTHQPMYAVPADMTRLMDFNEASGFTLQFGNKKDYRLPDQAELEVLWDNRDKGALKGTFNMSDPMDGGWYWSSEAHGADLAYARKFVDGTHIAINMTDKSSVRFIRSATALPDTVIRVAP